MNEPEWDYIMLADQSTRWEPRLPANYHITVVCAALLSQCCSYLENSSARQKTHNKESFTGKIDAVCIHDFVEYFRHLENFLNPVVYSNP